MPAHPFQTNFTGGEITPNLLARTDWEKYQNCASCLLNFVPRPHGGAARRAGTAHVALAKDPTSRVRLVRFEFSIQQAYIEEFGDLYIRFYANRGRVEVAGVPVEVASPYTVDELRELRFEQSADVQYIAHRAHPPMKLQRTSATTFQLDVINFNPPPTFERAILPAADLTLTSAAIGTGITASASASVWLAGDVGRQIRSGVGRAVITAVGGATSVTVTILDAFDSTGPIAAGDWSMDGSANAGTLLISSVGPVNSPASFTASLAAYRSEDVGKYINAAGGLAQIVEVASDTVANAIILKTLSGTAPVTVVAGAWTVESPVWSADLGYPGVVALHDQRLWFGGSGQFPDGVWGSEVGNYESFAVGIDDKDAVFFQLASPGVNLIRWLKGLSDGLGIGTVANEVSLSGGTDAPITATQVNAKNQTTYGSDLTVDAIRIANVVIFIQRGARRVREFAFDFVNSNSYVAADLAIIAEHLTRASVVEMAYASSPDSILFLIRPDGVLLTLTYERPENVVGWAHHETTGAFESVAVIPNNCGSGDEVWVAVNRQVTSGSYFPPGYFVTGYFALGYFTPGGLIDRRGIEVFDGVMNTDAGRLYAGAAAANFGGLGHLEGQTVKAIDQDGVVYDLVVNAGMVTLPAPALATELEVGFHFTSTLQTLRPELSTAAGTVQMRRKHWNNVTVRVLCTHGTVLLNGYPMDYPEGITATPIEPYTGDMAKMTHEGWDREGQLTIQTTEPKPCTVLGISGTFQFDDA